MARLPSMNYLVQLVGSEVIVSEDGTDRIIIRYDSTNPNDAARAQESIYASEMSDEDKCFAHFWCGYFYAHSTGPVVR